MKTLMLRRAAYALAALIVTGYAAVVVGSRALDRNFSHIDLKEDS